MEREKMIEEMAGCENCYAKSYDIITDILCCHYDCEKYQVCEKLKEQGYRKVSDGAVVLTPEERDEEMKEYNRDIAEREKLFNELNDEWYNAFSRMETLYKVKCNEVKAIKSQNKILKKNADEAFQQGLNESRELYKEEVKEQVRKETAREILQTLKMMIKEPWQAYELSFDDLHRIAEKYGVEV